MSAWGPKAFENDLSKDYILTIVNSHIHPIIIEPVEDNTSYKKHKLAYYYDRFRSAIELMILFDQNNVFKFAKGYYDLAIEKLDKIMQDKNWLSYWDNESKSKSKNYLIDCSVQLQTLKILRDKAKD